VNRKTNFLFSEITTCFYDCQLFCWIKYSQLWLMNFCCDILPILPIFVTKLKGFLVIFPPVCIEFDIVTARLLTVGLCVCIE